MLRKKKIILFRVDSSNQIGYGHLMRCIALAESFDRKNITPLFVCKDYPTTPFMLIKEKNYLIEKFNPDLDITDEVKLINGIIKEFNPIATILDGYNFSFNYQKSIESDILVTIGSNKDLKQYSDIVVSPNIWVNEKFIPKSKKEGSLYLSGPDYILIRENFRGTKIEIKKDVKNILITLGGSKLQRYGIEVYNALKNYDYHFYLVIDEVHKELENQENITLIVNSLDLSEIMKKCDLAITTAGITSLELASLGVPFLYYQLEKGQENNISFYKKNDLGHYLGRIENFDEDDLKSKVYELANDVEERKKIQKRFEEITDFNGPERIRDKIIKETSIRN